MNVFQLQQLFLWCTVINYVLLMLWWLMFILPHTWIYNVSGKPFKMSPDEFDKYNLAGIGLYKLAIILFCLVPAIALRLIG